MKRFLLLGAILLPVCGAAYVSYVIGHTRGFEHALIRANSDFVGAMHALDKLRVGDTEGGIARIEAIAFSCANVVYRTDRPRSRKVGEIMLEDVKHYRQTYRTNSAEWTPAEQKLEALLASWK